MSNRKEIFQTEGIDLLTWLQQKGVELSNHSDSLHPGQLYLLVYGKSYPELVIFKQSIDRTDSRYFPELVFTRFTEKNDQLVLRPKRSERGDRYIGYGDYKIYQLPPVNHERVSQSLNSLNRNTNSKKQNKTMKYNANLKPLQNQLQQIFLEHKNNIEKYPQKKSQLNNITKKQSQLTRLPTKSQLETYRKKWMNPNYSYLTERQIKQLNQERSNYLNKYAKRGVLKLLRSRNKRIQNAINAEFAEQLKLATAKQESETSLRNQLNRNKAPLESEVTRIQPVYSKYNTLQQEINKMQTSKESELEQINSQRNIMRKQLQALQSLGNVEAYKKKFAKYGYTYRPASEGRLEKTSMIEGSFSSYGEGFEYITNKPANESSPNKTNNGFTKKQKVIRSESTNILGPSTQTYIEYTYTRPLPPGFPGGLIPREKWDAALAKLDSLGP